MKSLLKLLIIHTLLLVVANAFDFPKERYVDSAVKTAKISPEIVNELKDFETLIPEAKIDAIVAEHYLVDGNFRKAFKYLRSNEFTQLQKQLLDVAEIIEVLDFLHMTINATIPHSNVAATDGASSSVNDNGMDKTTTNAATTGTITSYTIPTSVMAMEASDAVLTYERPQLDELENTVDVSGDDSVELPLLDIVLLGGRKVTANDGRGITDHHLLHHQHPVGTFTSFVEDIIKQLPRTAYQNMIIEKCKKNAKFADFYRALRSAEFEPLMDEVMKSSCVAKIINTLSANDVDVKSLKPIGFKVISWGPKP